MAQKSKVSWIAVEQVTRSVTLEPVAVLLLFALAAWLAYKILLRRISYERHHIFQKNFQNLSGHIVIGLLLFGLYRFSFWLHAGTKVTLNLTPYFGFFAVIWGCVILIKILRIIAYEFLFLTSMKAGVPMLVVNIFTLVVSLVLGGWVMNRYFEVDLAPLLATSAILSIVLGLALQDTLGNLFAAIALQIDKPFELGDWIELKSGSEKIAGRVQEISWRSTVLLAPTDELVTIPNRNIAQSQVSNFATRKQGFIRSHIFRIPFGGAVDLAKEVLLVSAHSVPGILRSPEPVVFITETTESWITLKAIYNIADYGSQFSIADRFLTTALKNLNEAGINLAQSRLEVVTEGARR